jgi:hypothetical protein
LISLFEKLKFELIFALKRFANVPFCGDRMHFEAGSLMEEIFFFVSVLSGNIAQTLDGNR